MKTHGGSNKFTRHVPIGDIIIDITWATLTPSQFQQRYYSNCMLSEIHQSLKGTSTTTAVNQLHDLDQTTEPDIMYAVHQNPNTGKCLKTTCQMGFFQAK